MEHKHLHPPSACLAIVVMEVLASHCSSPELVRSWFCLERREGLQGCVGHHSQESPCPKAGRHALAQLLSLRCHPHLQKHLRRSPHFSWQLLSLGLSWALAMRLSFSSLAVGHHISNISGGFTFQVAADFAEVSSPLATGLLLILQGWDLIWWRRKN